jgi:hypothetical protein
MTQSGFSSPEELFTTLRVTPVWQKHILTFKENIQNPNEEFKQAARAVLQRLLSNSTVSKRQVKK